MFSVNLRKGILLLILCKRMLRKIFLNDNMETFVLNYILSFNYNSLNNKAKIKGHTTKTSDLLKSF